jgi:hypothetical protein
MAVNGTILVEKLAEKDRRVGSSNLLDLRLQKDFSSPWSCASRASSTS